MTEKMELVLCDHGENAGRLVDLVYSQGCEILQLNSPAWWFETVCVSLVVLFFSPELPCILKTGLKKGPGFGKSFYLCKSHGQDADCGVCFTAKCVKLCWPGSICSSSCCLLTGSVCMCVCEALILVLVSCARVESCFHCEIAGLDVYWMGTSSTCLMDCYVTHCVMGWLTQA